MRFRLPSLSNLLRHLPAHFLAPPRPGSAGEQYLTHEKIRASLGYFGNRVRFLPWIDGSVVDETTEMRESYRQMLREPAIKAAFFKKILCVAQLDLQVHPASDSAIDQEVAAFVSDALNGCRGGVRRIVYSILSGAVMDGYSVCEKVWQVQDRGRWQGRVTLKALKSKDTRWLELIGDTYRNVTHVRDLRTSYSYAAENFVIYAHLPMFETPLGMSDFRAAYRAYWIMDAAWKLRSILLERYTLPFLMGSYPMARKDLRPALEESLENARAQGWVSLPEGAKIEAIQLATKGESDFKSAIQDLTSEMVLAIEGATLQTLQGTVSDGRGNSLVHQDSSQILTGFLAAEVADVLSSQLVPSLVDINVAGAAYPRLTLSSVDDGALLQSLQVDEGLQKLGLPLSKKAAYEKYSRQKPSDAEDALEAPPQQPGGQRDGQAQSTTTVPEARRQAADSGDEVRRFAHQSKLDDEDEVPELDDPQPDRSGPWDPAKHPRDEDGRFIEVGHVAHARTAARAAAALRGLSDFQLRTLIEQERKRLEQNEGTAYLFHHGNFATESMADPEADHFNDLLYEDQRRQGRLDDAAIQRRNYALLVRETRNKGAGNFSKALLKGTGDASYADAPHVGADSLRRQRHAEQQQACLNAWQEEVKKHPELAKEAQQQIDQFVKEERAKFEKLPQAQQDALRPMVGFLYGDHTYFRPGLEFDGNGIPHAAFLPTPELQKLQLQQAMALNKEPNSSGLPDYHDKPLPALNTSADALAWYAKFGSTDPSKLTAAGHEVGLTETSSDFSYIVPTMWLRGAGLKSIAPEIAGNLAVGGVLHGVDQSTHSTVSQVLWPLMIVTSLAGGRSLSGRVLSKVRGALGRAAKGSGAALEEAAGRETAAAQAGRAQSVSQSRVQPSGESDAEMSRGSTNSVKAARTGHPDSDAAAGEGRVPTPDSSARSTGTAGQTAPPRQVFPQTPEELDRILGTRGTRIPDGPTTPGRGKVVWTLPNGMKITFEQHPYHPSAPDWHRGPHYHVDPPGGPPHQRFLPGDPIPGT